MSDDPRQCPICKASDQHVPGCMLDGKEHVYANSMGETTVQWDWTLQANGLADYDVPGARWVDYLTPLGYFEEQLDVSRIDGKWRHRPKVKGDEVQANLWREGRAPAVHIDTRGGFHKVDQPL